MKKIRQVLEDGHEGRCILVLPKSSSYVYSTQFLILNHTLLSKTKADNCAACKHFIAKLHKKFTNLFDCAHLLPMMQKHYSICGLHRLQEMLCYDMLCYYENQGSLAYASSIVAVLVIAVTVLMSTAICSL
jgi:hypothetical protein